MSQQQKSYFKEDAVSNEMTLRRMMVKIWPYLWKHKPSVIGIVVAVLFFVGAGRALPMLFGHAVDEGIKKDNLELVWMIAGAYLALELVRAALSFTQNLWMQKLGNRALYEIREKLINHVQRLPIAYFDKNPTGRTVTRVTNDISSLGELFSQGFTAIFVNTFEMVSILIALSFISVRLTLLTALMTPVLIYISLKISKKIRAQFKEIKKKLAAINAFVAESLNGMRILQLFGRTEARQQRFEVLSKDYRTLQLGTVRLFALLWPILEGLNVFTIAAALFFGALYRTELGLTIGSLSAFILLLQSLFRPLRVILERYNQVQNSLASADRVFNMLDEKAEDLDGTPLPKQRLRGSIQFKNLSFRYGTNDPYALKDINLDIRPGESIALVGRTGSGKSTMISLLQKLYNYEEGEILVDGIPLRKIAPQDIRSRVGVVQQNNFIFKGTIASNINLNNPSIAEHRIKPAALRANCHHLLERHEKGLEAPVDENGANLSHGERQLIAFARVLAFDPDIMILDEATANIDSMNELRIQHATEEVTRDRTSLIIAHRLSTILHCDRIVVLDKARIVEVGSHRELLELKGKYWELYNTQFRKKGKPKAAVAHNPCPL